MDSHMLSELQHLLLLLLLLFQFLMFFFSSGPFHYIWWQSALFVFISFILSSIYNCAYFF
jgi:hypothetical protein